MSVVRSRNLGPTILTIPVHTGQNFILEHLGVEAYSVPLSREVYFQTGSPGTHSARKPPASAGVGGDTDFDLFMGNCRDGDVYRV